MVERALVAESACKREAECERRMGRAGRLERRLRVRSKRGRRRVRGSEPRKLRTGSGYNMGQAAEGGTMRCQ
jgi:hypothetical protein